jgi:phosphoribosylglycinamide formyltransferase-1
MRILTEHFVSAFPMRILNTHPALCPSFPGVSAARQALDYGVKVTGCTVHLVDAGVDTGPIVFQAVVPVEDDDDETRLHERIRAHEHRLLPEATRLLAEGRLRVEGRRVRILPG